MLRYRLAAPSLLAHRIMRLVAPGKKGPGFRVLLFHDLQGPHMAALDTFIAHVKTAHGTITPAEAEAWLDGAPPEKYRDGSQIPCLFSFDDGFRSNLAAAQTVLARHGIKALFFIIPGLVDLTGENQRAALAANVFSGRLKGRDLAPEQCLMTWDELAQLRDDGHTLAAHGMMHRRLCRLSGPGLVHEVVSAGDRMEERLGIKVTWYAYAFGDVASLSAEAVGVIADRYEYCRSGVRGINGAGAGDAPGARLSVRGDMIDLDAPLAYRKLVIEGGLDGRYRDARKALDAMAAHGP